MDIFISGISFTARQPGLTEFFASIIHQPRYDEFAPAGRKLNFRVTLFRGKRNRYQRNHSGCGLLTVPDEGLGRLFLERHGGSFAPLRLAYEGRQLLLQLSNKPLRMDIVQAVRRMPFVEPQVAYERQRKLEKLSEDVKVSCVQFGWECRDGAFSIEWEDHFHEGRLQIDDDEREIVVAYHPSSQPFDGVINDLFGGVINVIAMRYSDISFIGIEFQDLGEMQAPSAYFELRYPPVFGKEPLRRGGDDEPVSRTRVCHFDTDHERVIPYTSMCLRVLVSSDTDLALFRRHCSTIKKRAEVHHRQWEFRQLFSQDHLEEFRDRLSKLPTVVAFQCEILLRDLLLDPTEGLEIFSRLERLVELKGARYAAEIVKELSASLRVFGEEKGDVNIDENLTSILSRVIQKYQSLAPRTAYATGVFDCMHAQVTPTSILLCGPYPERSNRVIRSYPSFESHFLRVEFSDENRLRYRFDRRVSNQAMVEQRVGGTLRSGVDICGRHFEFLAYSMSALKEHTTWFIEPFKFEGRLINAETIRKGLGNFEKVIRYPALYAARISQAFTATDPSVTVEPDEMRRVEDVERNGWTFTDGHGTLSPQLADEIWDSYVASRKATSRNVNTPQALQIRIGGAKGMISVDNRLSGRAICVRPSMVKFESDSSSVEIARFFDKPTPMFLNRPLVMLLEGLGVPADVFLALQREVVSYTKAAAEDILSAARLLESFGLGSSFRVPGVFTSLQKLGLNFKGGDPEHSIQNEFSERVLSFAVNHGLRELKYHARIPVEGSWTLVGVADVHDTLPEGEIIACVLAPGDVEPTFLEGDCYITRSPVIHPGDIQRVKAVGRPEPGSPYAATALVNTVVFSVRGDRPLPSCLGGGDLDGDVYNIIMNPLLFPTESAPPGDYPPVQRRRLAHRCSIGDIINFFVEYIHSDMLGVIAKTWLKIADQESIFDDRCLTLAELHSQAVDYQKSGNPVPRDQIPQPTMKENPDWDAPETVSGDNLALYYESTRAIGKLYRDIELDALQGVSEEARKQRQQYNAEMETEEDEDDVEDPLGGLIASFANIDIYNHPISSALWEHHSEHLAQIGELREGEAEQYRRIFYEYRHHLQWICQTYTLSRARHARLTEEEVLVGTIMARTSQPRQRKDLMASMREDAAGLVARIREDLSGDKESPLSPKTSLRRSWLAWQYCVQRAKQQSFGANSFGYIALGSLFEAIRALQEEKRAVLRRQKAVR